jgi:nitrogen fixation protein FixH
LAGAFFMSCCGVFIMPPEPEQTPARAVLRRKEIDGRFVLLLFLGFFGVVFAVNGVMVTLALRTMPGLDARNGYVASQAMNAAYAAVRAQAERGWTADLAVYRDSRGDAPVEVSIRDKEGQPVRGLTVSARLAHPALAREDRSVELVETTRGRYVGVIAGAKAGSWTLAVEATHGGERLYVSRNRLTLAE